MPYMYGATDDKFVQKDKSDGSRAIPLLSYDFFVHPILKDKQYFDQNDVSIVFKVSPDTLLNLASKVVDALPLPSIYEWNNKEVCAWIRKYGYPHYQNTFRVNLINGHTLLLLDATALSTMNIKNFHDIQHIAYGIRMLFHFEMTKFARSISLAPEYHYELYKLFRVKTGASFDKVRRTDLWRQMQLIRKKSPNLSHWELLERWLAREPDPEFPELFGGVRRYKLYGCKKKEQPEEKPPLQALPCECMPPCECAWTERDLRRPWRFTVLPKHTVKAQPIQPTQPTQPTQPCNCMPPCICHWRPKNYETSNVISVLRSTFPNKYGSIRQERTFSVSSTLASFIYN